MKLLLKYVKAACRISENWNNGFAGGSIWILMIICFYKKRAWLIYFGVYKISANIGIFKSQLHNKTYSTILQRYLISTAACTVAHLILSSTFHNQQISPSGLRDHFCLGITFMAIQALHIPHCTLSVITTKTPPSLPLASVVTVFSTTLIWYS